MLLATITETFINETSQLIRETGLPMIVLLMALSCACIPIPAEIPMLFGGFIVGNPAENAHAELTLIGVILAGIIGTLIGSWLAYGVGRGGRVELFERHGAKFHVGVEQLARADEWFVRHGDWVVCWGRLVPIVRAVISLPAGVAKMGFWRFTILTTIGGTVWCVVLAVAGRELGSEWTTVKSGLEYVTYAVVALIVALLVRRRVRKVRARRELPTDAPV
jgi:membrane protein DedA with SNARE-associated domain